MSEQTAQEQPTKGMIMRKIHFVEWMVSNGFTYSHREARITLFDKTFTHLSDKIGCLPWSMKIVGEGIGRKVTASKTCIGGKQSTTINPFDLA